MKKHVVTACTACRKRKVKCIGNPCAYCLKKNYICEFQETVAKRGPKVKLPTVQHVDVLNQMQESMGKLCMQQDYVDFYFECIGIPIPKAYKSSFTGPTESQSAHRTQLYIIMASIMKMAHGNNELEMQYIHKAHKSSSLFDNDTVESAISQMMMAIYIGNEDPKARNLVLMANNILKLPTIKDTELVKQTKQSCSSLCTMYDPSVSKQQKASYVLNGLLSIDLGDFSRSVCGNDLLTVGFACINSLLLLKANFDTYSVSFCMASIHDDTVLIAENDTVEILNYIDKFEKVVKSLKDLSSNSFIHALFLVQWSKFIVEWKSGNIQKTLQVAQATMAMFKCNSQLIATRSLGKYIQILLLPFFFQKYGVMQEYQESVKYIESAFEIIGKREEYRRLWEEMCGTLHNYKIGQLEEELFGNYDNLSAYLVS